MKKLKIVLLLSAMMALSVGGFVKSEHIQYKNASITLIQLVQKVVAQEEYPGDSTKRGEMLYFNGQMIPCAKASTNYC